MKSTLTRRIRANPAAGRHVLFSALTPVDDLTSYSDGHRTRIYADATNSNGFSFSTKKMKSALTHRIRANQFSIAKYH